MFSLPVASVIASKPGGGVAWESVVLGGPGILSLFFATSHTTMLVMMAVIIEDTRAILTPTDTRPVERTKTDRVHLRKTLTS